MMGLRNSFVLCLALMLSFSSVIHCTDIIKTLGQYPEYATFSKYLTETKLVEQINSAKAVTVLVVEDKDLAFLAGKPIDAIKTVIGTNIITEFYNEKKLFDAIGSQAELPTLSPAPGVAGKIKVQLINDGEVTFSSAVPGSKPDTFLVRTVATETEVLSVLKVDKPIVTVDASTISGATTSTGTQSVAETPNSSLAEAPGPSASSRTTFGFAVAVMAFASIFVSL